MIILIGGSSHVGKTYLAQKLMEKLNYPYISLDHLKMAFIRTKMTELTTEDDYEMRYFLWPFAAEMIKTAIENDQNMIVEGCYIPGEWRDSFDEEYLCNIRCVFIVMSEEYIRSNEANIRDYASVVEHRLYDEVDIERLIMCSNGFAKDCIDYGIECIRIEKDFNIENMVDVVTDMLRK